MEYRIKLYTVGEIPGNRDTVLDTEIPEGIWDMIKDIIEQFTAIYEKGENGKWRRK